MRPPILAVALLMVALPNSMLAARWVSEGSRPTSELPASWQMYSATLPPTYTGTSSDGSARRLDVGGLPPLVRAVGSGRLVVDRLCGQHEDLVLVRRDGGPDPGVFRC